MLFLLFFLSADPTYFTLSEATMDQAELSDTGYGFVAGDLTYISFMSRIVAIENKEHIRFVFDKRGEGPGELKSGGPILGLKDKVFCVDAIGFKLVRFSKDLKFEKSCSLKNYGLAKINFLSNGEQLFSFAELPSSKKMLLEEWDPNTLKKKDTSIVLPIEMAIGSNPLTCTFLNSETLLVAEQIQVADHLYLHEFNLRTQDLQTFGIINPDYDDRSLKHSKNHRFNVLRYGVEIRSISHNVNHIFLSVLNYDPDPTGRLSMEAGYRFFAIDKSNMELIDFRDVPFVSISGHHRGALQVMENQDGEVAIADLAYFLRKK